MKRAWLLPLSIILFVLTFIDSVDAQCRPLALNYADFQPSLLTCVAPNTYNYYGNVTLNAGEAFDALDQKVTILGWFVAEDIALNPGRIRPVVRVRLSSSSAGSVIVTQGARCPIAGWLASQFQFMALEITFEYPFPANNITTGIAYKDVYQGRMCSSAIATAMHVNTNNAADRCVTGIDRVDFRALDSSIAFPFAVDVTVKTGACTAQQGLSVVLIAVIIVAVIVVILAAVGILVYLRYKKRYGRDFQTQFTKENRTTQTDSRKVDKAMGF